MKQKVDKWVWHEFNNRARSDGCKFSHWMKESEVGEDYPFARFNRKVDVVSYTDDEYKQAIMPMSTDWTKRETDHLFRLCERYSLRFIVIGDRYEDLSDNEE